MRTPRNLALAAIGIFLGSYFLPAYGNGSGFACFGFCWDTLQGHDTTMFSGGWFYYSGFVVANVLFIALVAALFATSKSRKVRSMLSVVFFLHVLSWFAVHLFQRPPDLSELKIGYYVWLFAYGLLVTAHFWRPPNPSLEQVPVSH